MAKQAQRTAEKNNKQTVAGLTSRQQQILELMQQGKVNKEIARDLDISLGTVKQHLVAIFKKLNVQNRTMAVARLAEFKDQSGFSAAFANETLIARRPAIVLSLKTNGRLPRTALKLFHTRLAEVAFDSQALFMSREPGDGDLIFGLKRSSAQDIRTAILVADYLFQSMSEFVREKLGDPNSDQILTGALVAGLITVSQNRFGGWSGETVGSHVLTWGHELRDNADTGSIYFDEPVKSVMKAFDITLPDGMPNQLPLNQVKQLNTWDQEENFPLIGREKELAEIQALLDDDFSILIIEGENGMGKSRLCRESARLAVERTMPLHYVRVVSAGFFESVRGLYAESWIELIGLLPEEPNGLVIIDDAHHLSADEKTQLTAYLTEKRHQAKFILCGRQPQQYEFADNLFPFCRKVHLQRMESDQIEQLVSTAPAADNTVGFSDIVERSRGIPLFAKELMLQEGNEISLALLITVASRIDKFKVDWKLLYCVAGHEGAVSVDQLAALMRDDSAYIVAAVERAESLGVLHYEAGQASFRHPLVQDVVRYLFQPNNNSVNSVSGYL
ncbi:LuxR C-terminal-related transcriptional regulator [Oceanospirillum sanctuarii]|uniref:LuxR C-terminal-related transcriptional regulator n=1 Tax=Oceanospirillum sanctuarii TaxID=1434821 RepID=UPI001C3D51DA|nr:LuxR C-terminal-related transcriptional regulator [Oceanospirillum sanctuarii]